MNRGVYPATVKLALNPECFYPQLAAARETCAARSHAEIWVHPAGDEHSVAQPSSISVNIDTLAETRSALIDDVDALCLFTLRDYTVASLTAQQKTFWRPRNNNMCGKNTRAQLDGERAHMKPITKTCLLLRSGADEPKHPDLNIRAPTDGLQDGE